jgi:hypothetical protein
VIEACHATKADESPSALHAHLAQLADCLTHRPLTARTRATVLQRELRQCRRLAKRLDEEVMLVHYLKHLTLLALRHSLIKTVVGFGCLLFRYRISEVEQIYEALERWLPTQGQWDDKYFYHRKQEVMEAFKTRFGPFLHFTETAQRGGRSCEIKTVLASPAQQQFIKSCLDTLAPSLETCPTQTYTTKGSFLHRLMHSLCFERVLTEARLGKGSTALFLPVFCMNNSARDTGTNNSNSNGAPREQQPPPALRPREQLAVERMLRRLAQQCAETRIERLRILIDGREYAQLDPDQPQPLRLRLDEGAELLEARAQTMIGEMLLAQHLFSEEDFQEAAEESVFSTVLANGQQISFTFLPRRGNDESLGAEVEITCHDLHPLPQSSDKSVALTLAAPTRLAAVPRESFLQRWRWLPPMLLRPLVTVGVFVTIGLSLLLYFQRPQPLTITTFSAGRTPLVADWGIFQPGQATVTVTPVIDPDPQRGDVLRMDYQVPQPDDYVVFWLKFAAPDFQPAEWTVVTFWARSEAPTKVKIELKLQEKQWGWKMRYINVTNTWQQYRLPLREFQTMAPEGWKQTDEFVVAFDRELTSPTGVFFLDDIRFEKK